MGRQFISHLVSKKVKQGSNTIKECSRFPSSQLMNTWYFLDFDLKKINTMCLEHGTRNLINSCTGYCVYYTNTFFSIKLNFNFS